METIRKEFRFVFKNIMDRDHFEDNIYFRDPITTNLNSFRGAFCQSALALWCASRHDWPARLSMRCSSSASQLVGYARLWQQSVAKCVLTRL